MINNKPPNIVKSKDHKTIQNDIYKTFQNILGTTYNRLDNDILSITTEAFSYDVVKQRAYLNNILKGLFIGSAVGGQIDDIASNIGLVRINGSYPVANITFSSSNFTDIVIKKDTRLCNVTSGDITYSSIISDIDLIIPSASIDVNSKIIPGELTCSIELNDYIECSSIKTEILVNPIDGVTSTQESEFIGGTVGESDEKFKSRYYSAWHRPSTAGSSSAYKYHTYLADNRITDVVVYSDSDAVVNVFYYSVDMDETMNNRVINLLNRDDVKPLTDKVVVSPVIVSTINIVVNLYIDKDYDYTLAYNSAKDSLNKGLDNIAIGSDISRSYVVSLLMVDGVRDIRFINLNKEASDGINDIVDEVIIVNKNEKLIYKDDAVLNRYTYIDREIKNV